MLEGVGLWCYIDMASLNRKYTPHSLRKSLYKYPGVGDESDDVALFINDLSQLGPPISNQTKWTKAAKEELLGEEKEVRERGGNFPSPQRQWKSAMEERKEWCEAITKFCSS